MNKGDDVFDILRFSFLQEMVIVGCHVILEHMRHPFPRRNAFNSTAQQQHTAYICGQQHPCCGYYIQAWVLLRYIITTREYLNRYWLGHKQLKIAGAAYFCRGLPTTYYLETISGECTYCCLPCSSADALDLALQTGSDIGRYVHR